MTQKQTKILIKVIIGLSLIFIIYCILLFMISQSKNTNNNQNKNNLTQPKTSNAETFEKPTVNYMLKAVNNNVYSFEILNDGTLNNVKKTDINIKYMREIDKNSLNEGIYVSTKDELLSLIEDFSS